MEDLYAQTRPAALRLLTSTVPRHRTTKVMCSYCMPTCEMSQTEHQQYRTFHNVLRDYKDL